MNNNGMMFTSITITPDRTPLLIGDFYDDAVLARTPKGEILRVPRFDIETPVLCCTACGKAVLLRQKKHTDKEYAECPDHARHMYESLFAASHDIKQFNHDKRRQLMQQAKHWLGIWHRQFERRVTRRTAKQAVNVSNAEIDNWKVNDRNDN